MIKDYLDDLMGEGTSHHTSKGLQISYKCPMCNDRKERLFVSMSRQVFKCHHCEEAGTTVSLIASIQNLSWSSALELYRSFEGYEKPLPENIEHEIITRLSHRSDIEVVMQKYVHPLPEEYIPIYEATGKKGLRAIKYIQSRGISIDQAIKQNIGYCAEGKYRNRIIMPDYEDGKLMYWQSRTWLRQPTDPEKKRRYRKVLNPSLTKEQIEQGIIAVDKAEIVGNIDSISDVGIGILVEGKFDQYTLGDMGACLHGKHMSDAQFIKLVKRKKEIETIVVCMDGDAFKHTMITADRLSGHFSDVLVCRLPEDADPNSLGAQAMADIIDSAMVYDNKLKIRAKLWGWI
ncbi:DNA primase [Exiguobacterium phage vB_EalM-132]|nr:DNA primase [Exiguobacterium phage vB_EalM-132]